MIRQAALFVCFVWGVTTFGPAQARSTASRGGDLQVGGGFTFAKPDYTPYNFKGGMFYVDFDFRSHWGIEGTFHQVNQPGSKPGGVYERTYEIGGRYHIDLADRKLAPYAKIMYGRGVFNYPNDVANLAYNLYAFGGGLDVRVARRINVRVVDFEYQRWMGFPPNGISPILTSVGVAYHFPSDRLPDR